jgi:hypothetical protein
MLTFDFGEDITMTRIDEKLDELLRGQNLRMKTGTFTPATDVHSIDLGIEPGANYVLIKSVTEPNKTRKDGMGVVLRILALDEYISAAIPEPGTSKAVIKELVIENNVEQYYVGDFAYNPSNESSVNLGDWSVFEAGMTYEWEAHWWNE